MTTPFRVARRVLPPLMLAAVAPLSIAFSPHPARPLIGAVLLGTSITVLACAWALRRALAR
ncbi:hypothetical protein K4749_11760 [Streptomyces sp. TRM72054]|uniref:hypothetical protein n=1 Tax=Streptomyces sp. TRM72054 TaxID=2870562 RepID=UPI001C8B8014|nr:hypothetical protein [Streptomyces sp. TRM72054]MBX9394256.1 hypothetical protein [Streptomyces sp. TRM72054]